MSKEWKLVPVEPTDEMKEAGAPSCEYTGTVCAALCYEAMLDAAPEAPRQEPAAWRCTGNIGTPHITDSEDCANAWYSHGGQVDALYTRSDAGEIKSLREDLESTKAALREEMKDAFEFQQKNAALIELLREVGESLWQEDDSGDLFERIDAAIKPAEPANKEPSHEQS